MDATELGRLTTAAWCGEKLSVMHAISSLASGDSTLSREGIMDAED